MENFSIDKFAKKTVLKTVKFLASFLSLGNYKDTRTNFFMKLDVLGFYYSFKPLQVTNAKLRRKKTFVSISFQSVEQTDCIPHRIKFQFFSNNYVGPEDFFQIFNK